MKKIDTTSPIFGQIEAFDCVYYFDAYAPLEIYKVCVDEVKNNTIYLNRETYKYTVEKFSYQIIDPLSNVITTNGKSFGIATSTKAAYTAINEFWTNSLLSALKKQEECKDMLKKISENENKLH